jgi:hypothetical protein
MRGQKKDAVPQKMPLLRAPGISFRTQSLHLLSLRRA